MDNAPTAIRLRRSRADEDDDSTPVRYLGSAGGRTSRPGGDPEAAPFAMRYAAQLEASKIACMTDYLSRNRAQVAQVAKVAPVAPVAQAQVAQVTVTPMAATPMAVTPVAEAPVAEAPVAEAPVAPAPPVAPVAPVRRRLSGCALILCLVVLAPLALVLTARSAASPSTVENLMHRMQPNNHDVLAVAYHHTMAMLAPSWAPWTPLASSTVAVPAVWHDLRTRLPSAMPAWPSVWMPSAMPFAMPFAMPSAMPAMPTMPAWPAVWQDLRTRLPSAMPAWPAVWVDASLSPVRAALTRCLASASARAWPTVWIDWGKVAVANHTAPVKAV
jgi:hypothetical protein